MATPASWVIRMLQPALHRLANATAPTGDAILHGLEHDLGRVASLEQGWQRLCSAAWALGFCALKLEPMPGLGESLPARSVNGPGPEPRRKGRSTTCCLSFRMMVAGRNAAKLHAVLGLTMLDFDPARFAAAAQSLFARFVALPADVVTLPADVVNDADGGRERDGATGPV